MTAALILAAGEPARQGAWQARTQVGTISAIQRIVLVFQRAGIERIAVVCAQGEDETKKLASHMNLVFLESPANASLLENVKVGLEYLQDKCSRVLISHVDVPLVSVETICTLLAARGAVCVPSYHGSEGQPMLLQAEHIPAVLSYQGEGDLAEAVHCAGLPCRMMAVEDAGVLPGIREEQEEARLIAEHDLSRLRPDFRLRLMREKAFYGPGTHLLLQLTQEAGSLLEACRQMGISYSKGRKMIAATERQMGCAVIESQQGGKTGGRSVLTEQGKALIRSYSAFSAEAGQMLEELFKKHFGN